MLALSTGHIIGIVITLIGITVVGIYAGRKVKTAADFTVGGRKASASVVAGTIMGTLVGGASTIGTAQLAFQFGRILGVKNRFVIIVCADALLAYLQAITFFYYGF